MHFRYVKSKNLTMWPFSESSNQHAFLHAFPPWTAFREKLICGGGKY